MSREIIALMEVVRRRTQKKGAALAVKEIPTDDEHLIELFRHYSQGLARELKPAELKVFTHEDERITLCHDCWSGQQVAKDAGYAGTCCDQCGREGIVQ